jgi:hypothetical protein
MIEEQKIPVLASLSSSALKRYRSTPKEWEGRPDNLCRVMHAVCSGIRFIQPAEYKKYPHIFSSGIVSSLDDDSLGRISEAAAYVEHQLSPGHEPKLLSQWHIKCALSSAYHLLADRVSDGIARREVIAQTAETLGIELLPSSCICDEEVRDALDSIIRLKHKQSPLRR